MTIDKKPVHSERVKLKHSSYRFRFNQHERRNLRAFCSPKARYKSLKDDNDNDEDGEYEDRNCWRQSNYEETNQNLFYNQSDELDAGRTEINPAKCNFREQNITNNLQTIAYCFSRKCAKRILLPLNLYSSNGCGSVSLNCFGSRNSLHSIIRFLIICHILQVLPLLGNQETSKWATDCQIIDTISMLDHNENHQLSGVESADHAVVLENKIDDRRYRNSFDQLLDENLVLKDKGSIKGQFRDKNNEDELFRQKKRPLDFIKQERHHHRHEKSRRKTLSLRDRIRRNHDGFYENLTADRPVVTTRKGLVRGITQKVSTGKFVDAFLGIPFAQPPIGKYRFRHPQPTNPWTGELDASHMSNSCFQVNDTFFGANFLGTSIWNANTPLSEDCLYLNVWTPFGIANTTVPTPVSHNPVSQMNHQRVYKPPDLNTKLTTKRPVLVWIFGGGFYSGTSSLAIYEGGVLASEEDIIVVSMNYRVSALGFLYFGRPDAPGNSGLFDQLMALQWVNDNIDQFGGDPERVTIFGESAGAVSVAFHLLSPLSRNLFNQAILQSGAATCPWGFKDTRETIANGLQLASLVNCPSNNSDLNAVVECLLKTDPMSLVSQEVGQTKTILNFPFVPVVDGSFLLEPPGESLIKSNFKRARILLGSNYDEGNSFLVYLPEFSQCPSSGSSDENVNGNNRPQQTEYSSSDSLQLNGAEINGENGNMQTVRELHDSSGRPIESLESLTTSRQYSSTRQNAESEAQFSMTNNSDSKPCKPNDYPSLTRDDFLRVLKEDLNPYAEHPIGKEAIIFEYSNWNNPQDSVSNYDALDKIVGDYYFTCHVNDLAHRYALAGNQVYMYYFKQRSSMSPWPKWMGVLHADEINFVFGEPLNQSLNYTAKEVELSKRMMRYWGNFAKYGNPTRTGDNASMMEKWPEYADRRQYFELHGDFMKIGRGPRSKQCAFWAQYLPKMVELFDRRWRNQRAAASMNAQQRDQQAAAAAATATKGISTTVTTASTTITTGTTTNNTSGSIQQPPTSSTLSSSINRGRLENHRLPTSGMQMHNMRPTTSQLPTIGPLRQPITATSSHTEPASTEQSALDMAQSAAARVTGSAAAAIAAARFKMLRSNTLAAAFGRSGETEQQNTENPAPTIDLMAIRTKDERIVNTLSTSVPGGVKNRINYDLAK